MADDLSTTLIENALTGRFGAELRFFDEIESTNTEAMEWAAAGAPEGSLVVTDHQTGGRGRWGRSWFSVPGKLLQFSLILRPDIDPSRHGLITAGLGVATAAAIRALTGLTVEVKWPNDAVVKTRKLAGILVESTTTGSRIGAAVCGIGINVHLGFDEIPSELRERASSIVVELERSGDGPAPSRAALLGRIVSEIEALYPAILGDPKPLIAQATQFSAILGREVSVRSADGSTIAGTAEGFDADGALRLSVAGVPTSVHVGEIVQLRAT